MRCSCPIGKRCLTSVFSPHQDLVSERLSVLWQLKNGATDVLFAPVSTAMQRLAPPSFLMGRTFWLKTGQTLDLDRLRENLVEAGYAAVSNVVAAGEFAVRGGIVDLFPMGADLPYRIDLFDNEIDSIKTFDPDTQRTLAPVSEIRLLPAHEFPTDADAQKIFRNRFREEIPNNPNEATVYQAVGKGQFGAGVEYYLPLFFEDGCADLFDYIGENAIIVCTDDVHACAHRFWDEVKSRHTMAQGDPTYPPLPPQSLYLLPDQFAGCLKRYPQVWTQADAKSGLPDVAVNRQSDEPLAALARFQAAFGGKILLCAESAGRRETMTGFLKQHGFDVRPVSGWAEFLSDGFSGSLKPTAWRWLLRRCRRGLCWAKAACTLQSGSNPPPPPWGRAGERAKRPPSQTKFPPKAACTSPSSPNPNCINTSPAPASTAVVRNTPPFQTACCATLPKSTSATPSFTKNTASGGIWAW